KRCADHAHLILAPDAHRALPPAGHPRAAGESARGRLRSAAGSDVAVDAGGGGGLDLRHVHDEPVMAADVALRSRYRCARLPRVLLRPGAVAALRTHEPPGTACWTWSSRACSASHGRSFRTCSARAAARSSTSVRSSA